MQPRRLAAALALALAAATVTACSSDGGTAANDGKLLVATTVAPITSIAANIAGDRARVEGIVPEGTNSHTFEPAPQVAQLLSTADVVLVNGLKLEEPTLELAEKNLKDGAEVVELGTKVLPEKDYIYDFSFPREEGKPNPHLWTDPIFAAKYATEIADTLAAKDPTNADYYRANEKAFIAQTEALATALRQDQKSVDRKVLLTYHDAYAYFGKNFGWTIIGAVQPRNFEDPAPSEVANLIRQVRAEKVPTIFGSEVFPSAVLEEIGRATGARYEDTLRDDDLPGAPGDKDHSWLGLMRYNYVTMVSGLGGEPTQLKKLAIADVAPDSAVYPQ